MRAKEFITEAPLPPDWDTSQYSPGSTFKQRLGYALERAKRIGGGSSRIATVIEYEGRPTVLKIAKNRMGLLQNNTEVDILDDGYASQMGILIPLIDYDKQNSEPTWVQTELAQKATEKQLCSLIHCKSLDELVVAAKYLINELRMPGYQTDELIAKKRQEGMSEADTEIFRDYVHKLGDLKSSFDLELNDFARPANWGLYQGNPVIVDAGANDDFFTQKFPKRRR